ncbi:MAG: TrkH family potassium uptake protein [Mollicutes bacterium PWAP]|nr:TrkH family potassium uptake protein [Mollicutes bacterium PWAP]
MPKKEIVENKSRSDRRLEAKEKYIKNIANEKQKNTLGTKIFKKGWNWFRGLSNVKHILIIYFLITMVGSGLLMLPISQINPGEVKYEDSLFISASAFSDTGLVTITTSETWSSFGQAIIAFLILIGGLGWFAIRMYIFNIMLGRPINFRNKSMLSSERGSAKVGSTRNLILISISILLCLLLISGVILTLYFYISPDPIQNHDIYLLSPATTLSNGTHVEAQYGLQKLSDGHWTQNVTDGHWTHAFQNDSHSSFTYNSPHNSFETSLKYGLFHSISALNNAGFDIFGNASLSPYYHDFFLQFFFIIMFVIGGIGYPVIYDLWKWLISLNKKQRHKWSLFSKLSSITYLIVAILGVSLTFGIEYSHQGGFINDSYYGNTTDHSFALFFNSMSTRNAGFGSVEYGSFSDLTLFNFSILMFIGSAPSSTAGGIRTTTIAIVILSIWGRLRNRKNVRAFKRRINKEIVTQAFVVFAIAIIIVLAGTFVIMSCMKDFHGSFDSNGHSFVYSLFETASAFGTTGLSTGITSSLSLVSKIILIIIMFIGQIGVSSTLMVWGNRKSKSRRYEYVEEDISIG